MKHRDLLNRALKLQRRIDALGLKDANGLSVKVCIGAYDRREAYIYLKYGSKSEHFSLESDDKEIIDIAKSLTTPTYKKIKNICINVLNEDVYIEKDDSFIELSVVSISKDGLRLSDDNIYNIDDVFIKE